MKKYGITILCNDTMGETYVDTINKLFHTKAQAEKELDIAINFELESLGENYTRVDNSIENAYCETISTYQIWEYEIEDNKHPINLRQSLLLDFKQALDETEFGNEQNEDDTYHHLLDQMDIQYRDKDIADNSLTLKDITKIINTLDDIDLTFAQVLTEIVCFLENKKENKNAKLDI